MTVSLTLHPQAISNAAQTVCGRNPAPAEKYPRAMIPPTINGAPPFPPDGGEYINKTNDNKEKPENCSASCLTQCAAVYSLAENGRNRPRPGLWGRFVPLSEGLRGTKRATGESEWVVTTHSRSQTPAVRTFSEFHFWVMTRLQKRFLGCKIKNP